MVDPSQRHARTNCGIFRCIHTRQTARNLPLFRRARQANKNCLPIRFADKGWRQDCEDRLIGTTPSTIARSYYGAYDGTGKVSLAPRDLRLGNAPKETMANPPRIWLDYRPVRIGWVIPNQDVARLAT